MPQTHLTAQSVPFTAPLPATPSKWTYRAIYHVGDAQVGLWSNLASLTVQA